MCRRLAIADAATRCVQGDVPPLETVDAKPKNEEPKKEEPKKEEPKQDEPKKDEPKKDEPRKEEPKDDGFLFSEQLPAVNVQDPVRGAPLLSMPA